MEKNYYEELGLTRDAGLEIIKKAYRTFARKYHPDISSEKDAEQKMQIINKAYDTLNQPEKKKKYDSELDASQLNPAQQYNSNRSTASNHSNFEDLFGGFYRNFSDDHSSHDQRNKNASIRGKNQYVILEVPLRAAFEGLNQQISLRLSTYDRHGQLKIKNKILEMKIPKGMKNGQHLRLIGQGLSGVNGAENGDLIVEIKYKSSPEITIDQADIFYQMNISPWQAALGQEFEVSTPTGKIHIQIPQNTIYGKKLLIPGKGIPAPTPGNLYLILNITYPQTDSSQYVKILEQFPQSFSHFEMPT